MSAISDRWTQDGVQPCAKPVACIPDCTDKIDPLENPLFGVLYGTNQNGQRSYAVSMIREMSCDASALTEAIIA